MGSLVRGLVCARLVNTDVTVNAGRLLEPAILSTSGCCGGVLRARGCIIAGTWRGASSQKMHGRVSFEDLSCEITLVETTRALVDLDCSCGAREYSRLAAATVWRDPEHRRSAIAVAFASAQPGADCWLRGPAAARSAAARGASGSSLDSWA